MKKLVLFFIGISILLSMPACSSKKDITNKELSDYKPMIYVQDNLYGETSDVISTLPDEMVYIGTIENVVSRSEPMVQENFTSNALPEGSKIYYDKSNPDVIYIELYRSQGKKTIYCLEWSRHIWDCLKCLLIQSGGLCRDHLCFMCFF